MNKTSTVKRIQQLCCLGLPGKAVAPLLLRELREVVPSYSNCFFWVDKNLEICDLHTEDTHFHELMPAYFGEFHAEVDKKILNTTFSKFLATIPTVTHLRAHAGDRLNASGFFNCIMRKMHYHNIAYTRIGDRGHPVGLLLQGLEAGRSFLSPQEEKIMAKLAPYIAHSLGNKENAWHAETGDEETGLLVFDCSGELRYASPKGKELLFLATHPGISAGKCNESPIPPELKDLCRSLVRIFGRGDAPAPLWRHKNDRGSFVFRAYWLESRHSAETIGITAQKMIPFPLKLWRKIKPLNLTPKQSDVCLFLAGGLTQSDIAKRMGISTHTVNWHIREIYGRLDVHSAADLRLRLLA